MLQSRRPTLSVAAALCAALLTGCQLLQPIATAFRTPKNLFDDSAENELPSIVASRDAISLELVFIERQVGDPLLGRALWNDVDQVGVMQPETRARLASNGFRVGHVGPTPPQALQTLLKLTDDALDLGNPADSSRAMQIRRVTLTSDMETEVHAAPQYADCLVRVVGSTGETEKSFTQALCQFRLKARRLQEGWAQIELTPEILHSRTSSPRISGNCDRERSTPRSTIRNSRSGSTRARWPSSRPPPRIQGVWDTPSSVVPRPTRTCSDCSSFAWLTFSRSSRFTRSDASVAIQNLGGVLDGNATRRREASSMTDSFLAYAF